MIRAYLTILVAGVLLLGLSRDSTPALERQQALAPPTISATAPMALQAMGGVTGALSATRAAVTEDVTAEQCANCHEDQVASFDRTEHKRAWHASHSGKLDCANCHGDPTAHLAAGGGKETMISLTNDLSPTEASEVCLNCHATTGEQSHTRFSEHLKAGVACITCHNPHPEADEKRTAALHGKGSMMPANQMELCTDCHSNVAAEISMPSRHRMKEGAMDCSSCHNVHGSLERRQVRAETRDQCLSCHTDKRGPFMFGHEVINVEGCTACHEPHGSAGKNMLKSRDVRSLCVGCHSKEMGKGVPHGRASATTMGDCTRCHTAVHGSNVDPFLLH